MVIKNESGQENIDSNKQIEPIGHFTSPERTNVLLTDLGRDGGFLRRKRATSYPSPVKLLVNFVTPTILTLVLGVTFAPLKPSASISTLISPVSSLKM